MNSIPILYVEDDDNDVTLLRHVFAKAGIRNSLHTVHDGQAAMDYLAGNAHFADRAQHPLPGLMLLDLKLPYRSGMEVLAWLRRQQQFRRLPVVVFTSSSRPTDVAQAYDAGANGYLVKPNSLEELAALVKAVRDFWLVHNQFPEAPAASSPGL